MEIELNNVKIDSEWTLKQVEEAFIKKGERANIAIDKTIIIDCGDDGEKSGFKIVFNQSYPNGSILFIKEYKFNPLLNKTTYVGEKWRRQ